MSTADTQLFGQDMKFVSPEVYDAFFAIVDRLEATIAEENAALQAQRHSEIPIYTRQKRQSFLELHRIIHAIEGTIPSQSILQRLTAFRTRVEDNERLLHRHMQAVQGVANTIVQVMRDFESDGTYSPEFKSQRSGA